MVYAKDGGGGGGGGDHDPTNKTTYAMGWFKPGAWSDKQDHLCYGVV